MTEQIKNDFVAFHNCPIGGAICRSSCSEVFCKKGVLKNFTKLTGKHLCWKLRCFLVNLAKSLKTTFYKTDPVASSVHPQIETSALTTKMKLTI